MHRRLAFLLAAQPLLAIAAPIATSAATIPVHGVLRSQKATPCPTATASSRSR